jgi:hypothetical protein
MDGVVQERKLFARVNGCVYLIKYIFGLLQLGGESSHRKYFLKGTNDMSHLLISRRIMDGPRDIGGAAQEER